jgi:hypothetical protein
VEIEKIVRILIWIAFITLAFLSIHYKYDACNVCKLEYKEQTLDGPEFMGLYSSKCLVHEIQDPRMLNYQNINITFVNP